jgi:hypothetical protein
VHRQIVNKVEHNLRNKGTRFGQAEASGHLEKTTFEPGTIVAINTGRCDKKQMSSLTRRMPIRPEMQPVLTPTNNNDYFKNKYKRTRAKTLTGCDFKSVAALIPEDSTVQAHGDSKTARRGNRFFRAILPEVCRAKAIHKR